jgi:hypothetical protein
MSVDILGEDGKPVEPTPPEPMPETEPQPMNLPKVVIEVKADGNLSITGPADPRLVLRMLHEATDLIHMGVVRNYVLEQIASQPVQKPGLRDVLAFSKVRPK